MHYKHMYINLELPIPRIFKTKHKDFDYCCCSQRCQLGSKKALRRPPNGPPKLPRGIRGHPRYLSSVSLSFSRQL